MHKACLKSIKTELSRTKEDFITDHFAKYNRPSMPPSWKTLEVVSFGTLGKLYSNFADTSKEFVSTFIFKSLTSRLNQSSY